MNLKSLKIILICGLILALLPLPYGYFTILRVFGCLVFILQLINIPKTKRHSRNSEFVICIVLIILFQPLLRLPLGRLIWNIVDVATAIWLLLNLNRRTRKTKKIA
ncbi:MAG: hypothetical protein K0R59_3218 [Sphingobacterium sp.]|jgi:hypothetical protein|nr:hypothetical protein [Sphingobacterium sp.]